MPVLAQAVKSLYYLISFPCTRNVKSSLSWNRRRVLLLSPYLFLERVHQKQGKSGSSLEYCDRKRGYFSTTVWYLSFCSSGIALPQLGVSQERKFCNVMPMWIFLLPVFRTLCKMVQDYLETMSWKTYSPAFHVVSLSFFLFNKEQQRIFSTDFLSRSFLWKAVSNQQGETGQTPES